MTIPAGWYDDGSGLQRWWDGQGWTDHTVQSTTAQTEPTVENTTAHIEAAVAPAAPAAPAAPETEAFTPPYVLQSAGYPAQAYSTQNHPAQNHPAQTYPAQTAQVGYPGYAHAQPGAPSAAPRRLPVLGLIGLGVTLLGVILSCIPPIAPAGWVALGIGAIVSIVSLFLRGAKWPGITGIGLALLGAILAVAVALFTTVTATVADDDPPISQDDQTTTEPAPPADDPADIPGAEQVFAADLEVGDCLPLLDWEEEVTEVTVVPCDQPHTDEVYLVTELPDGDFPGDEELQAQADELCLGAFEAFVGMSYELSELDFSWYIPTQVSWTRFDDRKIQCIVFSYEDVTGTLKGAAR